MQKETFCDFINCSIHKVDLKNKIKFKGGKYYCTQKGANWCWYLIYEGKYCNEMQQGMCIEDRRTQLQVVAALVNYLTKKRHAA